MRFDEDAVKDLAGDGCYVVRLAARQHEVPMAVLIAVSARPESEEDDSLAVIKVDAAFFQFRCDVLGGVAPVLLTWEEP